MSPYNYRKMNWEKFSANMETSLDPGSVWDSVTPDRLKMEGEGFIQNMQQHLGDAGPRADAYIGLRPLTWWNSECRRLYSRLQRIRKYVWAHRKYRPNQRAKFTDGTKLTVEED